ncbi:hypothetical protein RB2150_02534 [Rhodobacteraceae bacterium HTCC2150]|nr:hypothetical protein RB2150_02534 [Rhodobacteraceae bacterium HTCC2150]
MGLKRRNEFRQDAVRIALTSGLTRKQVADDLGVGMSTLNKWITAHRDTDVVSKEDLGLAQENDRSRAMEIWSFWVEGRWEWFNEHVTKSDMLQQIDEEFTNGRDYDAIP